MQYDDYDELYGGEDGGGDGGVYVKYPTDEKKNRRSFMDGLRRRGIFTKSTKNKIYATEQADKKNVNTSLKKIFDDYKYKVNGKWINVNAVNNARRIAQGKKPIKRKIGKKKSAKKTKGPGLAKSLPARLVRFMALIGINKYNKKDYLNLWNAAK